MGRRSIWSNEKILELTRKFVPAADEVWRLQNDGDPECRFFRRMVRGSDEPSRGTMQGTYVFAPGGQLLGAINTYSAAATQSVLEKALAKFAKLPPAAKRLDDSAVVKPESRWEDSYPDDGLVLRRTARDLPKSGDPKGRRSPQFNRDAVWFSKEEARQWLPEQFEVGAVGFGGCEINGRLPQFVFVDNVRGQTLPYHGDEVIDAAFRTEITAIDGDRIDLKISLETRAATKGDWLFGDNYWKPSRKYPRELAVWGRGKAIYNRKTERFAAFEILALGYRKGYTGNNGRGSKAKPGPIGFVLELAPKSWRVAPTFINLYSAGWVKHPK